MTEQSADDLAFQIRTILEPLEQAIDESRAFREETERYLAEKRARGLDDQTKALFDEASQTPEAPESMRRLGQRVRAGELTWDDVFAGQAGPDGRDFLDQAFATAAEHADEMDLARVEVPEAALETGVDPSEVDAEIAATLAEAQVEHDRVWEHELDTRETAPPAPGANDGITPA